MRTLTETQTIERLNSTQIVTTFFEENSPPPSFPGTGVVLGGRFNQNQFISSMRERLLTQQNLGQTSSAEIALPRIREIQGVTTLDYLNIDVLNQQSREQILFFINSIVDRREILFLAQNNRLNSIVTDFNSISPTLLTFLLANLENRQLFSYIHFILNNPDSVIHFNRYLSPIINIFLYHTLVNPELATGTNGLINNSSFFTDLNSVFTDIFLMFNQEQIENLNQEIVQSINENSISNSQQNATDLSNVVDGATIEIQEIQRSTNNRIDLNSIVRSTAFRNIMISSGIAMVSLFISNQAGVNPALLFNGLRNILSSNELSSELTTTTNISQNDIRLRDIFDSLLKKTFEKINKN